MSIKPTRGLLLGKLIEDPTKIGSVYVPENSKTKPVRAKILAVGDPQVDKKGKTIKPCASIGQVVYVRSKNHGQRIDWEGTHLIFLANKDIIGKV